MKRALAIILIGLSAALTSCIAVGGTTQTQQPTKGQQLIDLKRALDLGAITQVEYDQKKSHILASR